MDGDDDSETRTDESDRPNNNCNLVYQELGSSLLYRNENPNRQKKEDLGLAPPWAAIGTKNHRGQIPADLRAKLLHSGIQRTNRSQARWYYPLDFLFASSRRGQEEEEDEELPEEKTTRKRKRNEQQTPTSDYSNYVRLELIRQAREMNSIHLFEDKTFLQGRVVQGVQEARKALLPIPSQDSNEIYTWPDSHSRDMDLTISDARSRLLHKHQNYDHNYMPAQWKVTHNNMPIDEPLIYLKDHTFDSSLFFAQERRNRADPAYLAPFPLVDLHTLVESDMPAKTRRENKGVEDSDEREFHQLKQDIPTNVTSHKETDRTRGYGNCILCVPCSCPTCASAAEHVDTGPNWCLIHPVGTALDKLQASLITPPNGIPSNPLLLTRGNLSRLVDRVYNVPTYNEIELGDGIRQIEQCTSSVFLVRTSIHVSVISLTAREDDSSIKEIKEQCPDKKHRGRVCWGAFQLTELQRFDLRSFSRHKTSYFPVDVTCHRKFAGSSFTSYQYKFAILTHTKHGKECNIIHHFLWSPPPKEATEDDQRTNYFTKHIIRNLKSISQICFSAKHPMILWAAAESFVRPGLKPDNALGPTNRTKPRFGSGHSLYTIDLRSNEATFQWSPSAADFVAEGMHSIDAIAAELGSAETNTLLVSSVSAGKLWELDVNLFPLRIVKSWTLPYQVDNLGPNLPVYEGLYGGGRTLLCEVVEAMEETAFKSGKPLLSVGVGAESYGVHFYPSASATTTTPFQTDPLECAASNALSAFKEHRLATCSVFGSGNFFGIAPIYLQLSSTWFSRQDKSSPSAVVCIILMTSSGDIHAQTLSVSTDELPAGELARLSQRFPVETKFERKLVGGANIDLGVPASKSLVSEKESSNKVKNEQVEVRSFKRWDVRSMHVLSQEPLGEHQGIGNALVIEATSTNDNVVKNQGAPNVPRTWLIPSTAKSAERENLVYRCPPWMNKTKSSIDEDTSNTETGHRSDVNNAVLEVLAESTLEPLGPS